MLAFLEPLEELADYQEIVRKRGKAEGILQIAGCVSSQKTHLMYALGDGFEYRVIVFSSEEKAKQAYEEYKMLEENTFLDRKEEPGAGYGDHYGRCFFRWTSVKRKIVGKPY